MHSTAHTLMETKLTQIAAARAAGVSHTTIYRAIKQGRLSAERDEHGAVRVDASELLRVFPDADLERAHAPLSHMHADAHEQTSAHNGARELSALRALVEELKADKLHLRTELERAAEERARHAQERAQLAEERTRLSDERAQLLAMLKAQTEQMRLLTDQRTRPRKWWARWW